MIPASMRSMAPPADRHEHRGARIALFRRLLRRRSGSKDVSVGPSEFGSARSGIDCSTRCARFARIAL
jgi:hypothetical protein